MFSNSAMYSIRMTSALAPEFHFYLEHQREFGTRYFGKYIAIKNRTVLGCYDEELQAIKETARQHPLGTFLIQKCDPDPESCVQTFYSRVSV
jgi:hypothetical protein